MDFFEQSNPHIPELNINDKRIFEYVVKNIHAVKDMTVRTVAGNCYVSTTTIIRFVKKLGFDGYRHFCDSLNQTCAMLEKTDIPDVVWRREYSEEYLKNIIESVRVISQQKLDSFKSAVQKNRNIFFVGSGLNREVTHYAYRIFTMLGFITYHPVEDYEIKSMLNTIRDQDMLFVFSLSGEDKEVIEIIESASLKCSPVIASVTWSGNNTIQNLSDIDFYVFADRMTYNGLDLTSRISMLAIVELLTYSLISRQEK
jgi:RpiR family glv operon transcriptional regulator